MLYIEWGRGNVAFSDLEIYAEYVSEVTERHIDPVIVDNPTDGTDLLGNYTARIPSFSELKGSQSSRPVEAACSTPISERSKVTRHDCRPRRSPSPAPPSLDEANGGDSLSKLEGWDA